MQNIPGTQRASGMPTEFSQRERARAAQILGYIQSALEEYVSPCARTLAPAQFEHGPGLHRNGLPPADRNAIERGGVVCACDRNARRAVEAQRRTSHGAFEAGCAFGISQKPVAGTKRQGIHGAGRRHADMPVTHTPRVILYGGHSAAFENLDSPARGVERIEETRRDAASREFFGIEDL